MVYILEDYLEVIQEGDECAQAKQLHQSKINNMRILKGAISKKVQELEGKERARFMKGSTKTIKLYNKVISKYAKKVQKACR